MKKCKFFYLILFSVLEVKFSIYLNRHVFVMDVRTYVFLYELVSTGILIYRIEEVSLCLKYHRLVNTVKHVPS